MGVQSHTDLRVLQPTDVQRLKYVMLLAHWGVGLRGASWTDSAVAYCLHFAAEMEGSPCPRFRPFQPPACGSRTPAPNDPLPPPAANCLFEGCLTYRYLPSRAIRLALHACSHTAVRSVHRWCRPFTVCRSCSSENWNA